MSRGKCPNRWGRAQKCWRLDSRSTRTFGGPILELVFKLPSHTHNSKNKKTYRNPIIYAQELAEEMRREGLTQAELARKHGISRTRVNQWLSLLKLPNKETRRILAMGDLWERRLVTERNLRNYIKQYQSRTTIRSVAVEFPACILQK